MRDVNQRIIEQFRAGGPMNGMPRERMLLLTTTGLRTGCDHTTPIMFVRVDGVIVVVASNSGAGRHPDWYLNLVADARVDIEIGDERYPGEARVVPDDRRTHLWEEVVAQIPVYSQHQASTAREIPLVELLHPGDPAA